LILDSGNWSLIDIIGIMDANKERIRRYTSGKFSFNDYLSVSSGFQKGEFEEGFITRMEEDWNETGPSGVQQIQLNRLLDRLHHRIGLRSHASTNSFQLIYRLFSKVAAILLIPALITIAVLSYLSVNSPHNAESWVEIHSPLGSRTQFNLPDGTLGWLNSGSSIKYPVNFIQNRKVEVSGEAWFDVVHLKTSEFRVVTPNFDVKVVGTRFNVIDYGDEAIAEVILERGKILVLDKNDQVKMELEPDQQFDFNKSTKEFSKTPIDSKNYTSWKDGLLVFKNVTMAEIARRLERKYNTEIILHGDSLKSSIFRATFLDENMDEICKMLSTVAPIKYKIHKREKQTDNTFTKSTIEMWLKKNTNPK
jgi:transmembrane sensor